MGFGVSTDFQLVNSWVSVCFPQHRICRYL